MKNTIKFSNWITKINSFSEIVTITIITFLFVSVLCLLTRKKRQLYDRVFRSKRSQHRWNFTDIFQTPTYCNICQNLIVTGVYCERCNVFVDDKCIRRAEQELKCKTLYVRKQNVRFDCWPHKWVQGNLEFHSVCHRCKIDCGNTPGLVDYKCVWCWRTLHEKCLHDSNDENCDFGCLKQIILTPNCLECDLEAEQCLSKMNVNKNGVDSMSRNWTPIIVFANPKSGSADAEDIMKSFCKYLNPLQVSYKFIHCFRKCCV
jgi:diacylglycerol kinase (ATP)